MGQLLGDVKEKKDTEFKQDTGTWKGKPSDSTVCRTGCDRDCGPVARHSTL